MYLKVDEKIWQVQMYLAKSMPFNEAERTVYPLRWWVETGRASALYLKLLPSAKTFMIARKLAKGGSIQDCVDRVKAYLLSLESEVK